MPSRQRDVSQSMSDPDEDDVMVIDTSQSQEVLSTQLLQAAATDREAERNNAATTATNHLEKTNQVGRTWTRRVSNLPLNGQPPQKQAMPQPITGASPVTNFRPIIHVVVHLTMQISAM